MIGLKNERSVTRQAFCGYLFIIYFSLSLSTQSLITAFNLILVPIPLFCNFLILYLLFFLFWNVFRIAPLDSPLVLFLSFYWYFSQIQSPLKSHSFGTLINRFVIPSSKWVGRLIRHSRIKFWWNPAADQTNDIPSDRCSPNARHDVTTSYVLPGGYLSDSTD